MAGLKALKRRLASVKNTKKITYAMKLVSAAKLRKAQESVTKARDYTHAINALLAQISRDQKATEFAHPLMESAPEVKNIRLLIVGGGRGLCGGYNSSLHKRIDQFYREKSDFFIEAVVVGKKPAEYFRRLNRPYLSSFEDLPEDANLWPVAEISRQLETDFTSRKFDEAYVIYTKFKSALSVSLMVEKLIPLTGVGDSEAPSPFSGVTVFEPSAREIFAALIPRILSSKIRQAFLDAKASEHGSRMTAMDAATKNATEINYKLQLTYNKLRQSGITAELLDIIGGAEALN